MDRKNAIKYLLRKGKVSGKTKFTADEETKINEVIKKGKIYGDPVIEIEA